MSEHHSKFTLTAENTSVPPNHLFAKLPLSSAALGFVSLLVAFMLGRSNSESFFFSFHVWWLFYLSIAMGAVFFVLIQFATKAGWSVVLRRLAENIASTMPLFLVLLIVMGFGTQTLYSHWLSPEALQDKIIQSKQWYLNVPFFYTRAVVYLVLFSAAAFYFAKTSAEQDKTGNHILTYKMQSASIPFLIILGFAVTFASFDWIMSLTPHWYSTIFGIYFFASCYVSFFAALIIVVHLARKVEGFKRAVNVEHYHDMGKLLFGHSCFWAYAAFCQYFLIWYGNLPEETEWYGVRESNGWLPVFIFLIVGHFLVPFLFLMARKAKRTPTLLVGVSVWIIVLHFVDIYWLVMPSHFANGPHFSIVDLFCFLGIGGLFVALFTTKTKRTLLIPLRDPRLPESLNYENA